VSAVCDVVCVCIMAHTHTHSSRHHIYEGILLYDVYRRGICTLSLVVTSYSTLVAVASVLH
jgi:hypothetical protein